MKWVPPRAVVVWEDAFIDTEDFSRKDAGKTEPVLRATAGFYLAENQYGIVLSTDVYEKDDEAAAKMFIPWGLVKEWWIES